jgi:hypothetical protein
MNSLSRIILATIALTAVAGDGVFAAVLPVDAEPIPCGVTKRRQVITGTGFGSASSLAQAIANAQSNLVVVGNELFCDKCEEEDEEACFQTNTFFGDFVANVIYVGPPPDGQFLVTIETDGVVTVIVGCEGCD